MTQGIFYLKEGKVKCKTQVLTLAAYLTGKAYKFYMSEVAFEFKHWDLEQFFKGLFNHCFPAGFHLKQRYVMSLG